MEQKSAAAQANDVVAQEIDVLQKYGLRWSVLAAWRDALKLRSVRVADEVDRALEKARIKLVSGCFSVCDVGCDLSAAESGLTTADASSQHNWVDFWVDTLGHAMTGGKETERILKIPAVKARYQTCGIKGCSCSN